MAKARGDSIFHKTSLNEKQCKQLTNREEREGERGREGQTRQPVRVCLDERGSARRERKRKEQSGPRKETERRGGELKISSVLLQFQDCVENYAVYY